MKHVSDNWILNQQKKFVDESFVKLTLDVTDPEAVGVASASSSDSVYFSKTTQLINNRDKTIKNYATLEQNIWCLDGNNKILPHYDSAEPLKNIGDTGYVSNILSNNTRTFKNNPLIIVSFTKTITSIIPAITIRWNLANGEYAISFIIRTYLDNNIIDEVRVDDNSSLESIVYHDFSNYNKITIEIIEWCKAYSRIRITDIDLGITKEFIKEQLVTLKLTESVSPINLTIPQNDLAFDLDNTNEMFDPYDESGFYRYLTERQKIIFETGYNNVDNDSVEWIKMGEYYLSKWEVSQNDLVASFEAKNLLSFLDSIYIKSAVTSAGKTLYKIAEEILESLNLQQNPDGTNKWVISPTLQDITTTGIIPMVTCLEALQYVAQAGMCVLFCDNNSTIHIEPLEIVLDNYEINTFNSYANANIDTLKKVRNINVNCYTNKLPEGTDEDPLVATAVYTGYLDIDGSQKDVVCMFNQPILELSGIYINYLSIFGDVSNVRVYNHCCIADFSNCNKSTPVLFAFVGFKFNSSSRVITVINDPSATDDQDVDNPLISTYDHARNVGTWIKDYLNIRRNFSIECRLDPRLDVLDTVLLQNRKGTTNNANVTKIELTYNGGFNGRISGRLIE